MEILGKTTKGEDKQEPRKQGLKLNFISGKTFGMAEEGTKIMSIISVAGHQVVKNLSEPSEITLVHLDIYADYLREKDSKLVSRAVRALLTTGGPRLTRVDVHYIEVHGPYPILMNVGGIKTYTKAHATDASDQVGRIYIGREELKVRRIGLNATLKQDAFHIGCEADLAAHVLDVQGRQLSLKGLLDTGAVVSVMPVSTWTDMGFDRSDLIPTNIKHQTGGCQSGSNLCDRTDPDYINAAWRKTFLSELPGGGKFERIRPIHPGEGLRTQL